MTILIYGLIVYILFGFAKMSIAEEIKNKWMVISLKGIFNNYIVQNGYMEDMENNKTMDKRFYNMLMGQLINISAVDYSRENIAKNVPDELKITCFDKNEEFSLTKTDALELMNEETESDYNATGDNVTGENITSEGTNGYDITSESGTVDDNLDNNGANPAITVSSNIDLSNISYEYVMKNYYTIVSSTYLNEEDFNVNELLSMDMKMQGDNAAPQILIYHTHGQEGFKDTKDAATGIVGVGDYLTKLLTEEYGYNVIHLTDSFDYVDGVLDRHKAYDYAYERVAQILLENPSIEVVIDLHRDGVSEDTRLITEVNGKETAQIMFFNGISRLKDVGEIGYLYNPYRKENLAFSFKMKLIAENNFKGFTRRNYIQAYQYNLHMRPKSTLIEAGAQNNTFEEVKNAMEPLAAILNEVLKTG